MGANIKRPLSLEKACSALGFQQNDQREEVSWCKAVVTDEFVIKKNCESQELLNLLSGHGQSLPVNL